VARALQDGSAIAEVVWMGGTVAVGGNMTAAAELNAWMDPTAADDVLTSGVDVKMIPLDLTERFEWSDGEVEALRSAGRAGKLLARAIRYVQERDGVFVPHDAVAAIALTSPEQFGWSPRLVRCETRGEFTTGETVVDRRSWAAQDMCSWPRMLTSRRCPPGFSAPSPRLREQAVKLTRHSCDRVAEWLVPR
jgi:pyrimidine-specific ribonucleoside hydrolase